MSEEEGSRLLRTLARSMIELARMGRVRALSLPYPRVVQRALDHVVSVCLKNGVRPPESVPELVRWCTERTADRWPFPIPADLLRRDAVLVDPEVRVPTRTCLELSLGLGTYDEARDLLLKLDRPGGAGADGFTRRFLIEQPIVSSEVASRTPRQMAVWRRVRPLYGRVPAEHVIERRVAICPTCGLLARAERGLLRWCEAELCPRGVRCETPRADALQVLSEPLRLLLALPGRTELRVLARLEAASIEANLVDQLDSIYELSVPLHGKKRIRIVDRVEPALLAEAATEWTGTLLVAPRWAARLPGFRDAFAWRLAETADVPLIFEDEMVAEASVEQKGAGHA